MRWKQYRLLTTKRDILRTSNAATGVGVRSSCGICAKQGASFNAFGATLAHDIDGWGSPLPERLAWQSGYRPAEVGGGMPREQWE